MNHLHTSIAVMLVTASIVAVPASSSADTVRWLGTIEEAAAAARPANKPIMLDFWATWCAPCKVMESEVYTNRGFIRASESFSAVRINFDDQRVVARKYNVSALPTLVFTDSGGRELFRYVGVMALEPLTELLLSLPHDVAEFNRWNDVLSRDRNNFDALSAMGDALRSAGLFRSSNDHFARALSRPEARSSAALRESILSGMGENYLDVMDGRKAAEVFQKCLKEFPASVRVPAWTVSLTRARAIASAR